MPFSSGTFTPYTPGNPVVSGTTISADTQNNTINDIATGLSTCILKDGSQTVTANIPFAGFKLTGIGAATTNGDAVRWQQSAAGVMTTAGDWLHVLTANTPARLPAAATVAAHATTCDPWGARVVTLSGGAVTFTDLADADYVGQRVLLLMNAAHVWTDGAVFDVQGGATYTTAAGDWVELVATAVDAFDVTILPALGQPVSMQPITNSLSGDVALNNTSNYFAGPVVAQGTEGTWFVSGVVTCYDTGGAAAFDVKLWDGTSVIASSEATSAGASAVVSISLSGYISSPAGNLRIDVKDKTATTGAALFNVTGNSKDCTITAIRIR